MKKPEKLAVVGKARRRVDGASKVSGETLFADDIVYYREISSPTDIVTAQCDVDLITEWIASRHLRLNVNKSKLMVISI